MHDCMTREIRNGEGEKTFRLDRAYLKILFDDKRFFRHCRTILASFQISFYALISIVLTWSNTIPRLTSQLLMLTKNGQHWTCFHLQEDVVDFFKRPSVLMRKLISCEWTVAMDGWEWQHPHCVISILYTYNSGLPRIRYNVLRYKLHVFGRRSASEQQSSIQYCFTSTRCLIQELTLHP